MIDSPQSEPDYYAILGVQPDATPVEIERAYRQLAARRLNARWRPGRAGRELALINAAYEVLGYPERRVDYDRRRAEAMLPRPTDHEGNGVAASEDIVESAVPLVRYDRRRASHLPRVQLGRPAGSSPADAIMILLVVALAFYVGSLVLDRSPVNLSFVQSFGETLGISPRRRALPTSIVPATPAAAEARPSPAPATPTPATPPAPLGALPTAVAGQRFAGSRVTVSDPRPARGSDVSVTLTLVREGRPVPNANVYLVAHYRTVDERQPPGTSTVRTDANGTATIAFNIGDATSGHTVNLDVTALVDGQQVNFQSSFTPR